MAYCFSHTEHLNIKVLDGGEYALKVCFMEKTNRLNRPLFYLWYLEVFASTVGWYDNIIMILDFCYK